MDSSAVSKQLPSLVLYEGGKETKRRPLVDRRAVVTPYTFTEVCMYVLKAFFSSANFYGVNKVYYGYNNNSARASPFFVHFFAVTTRLQSSIFFFFFMEDVNKRRQILPLFEFLEFNSRRVGLHLTKLVS